MGELSKERLEKFKSIAHRYFDWEQVLKEGGVKDIKKLDRQLLLPCFRHDEKVPSCRVVLDKHYCHCFSCGYWGTIADVMYELSGKNVNKSVYFEQILQRDKHIQNELGFNSLFIDSKTLDPGFKSRLKFSAKNHIGSTMPMSVLFQKVKDCGDTWENMVYSLMLLQEGVSTDAVYSKISGSTSQSDLPEEEGVSLMDLFGDDLL